MVFDYDIDVICIRVSYVLLYFCKVHYDRNNQGFLVVVS